MKIFNTEQSKAILPKLFSNDRRIFGVSKLPPLLPADLDKRREDLSIYSSVFSDDEKQLLGFFTMAITTDAYYRDLVAGKAFEERFELWDGEDTPMLFLRHLVINDRRAVPYLMRYALGDLLSVCEREQIYLHRAFCLVPHWSARKLLESFQFEQTGLYQEKNPIMLASRDSSIFLNSYLKRYTADSE